MSLKEMLQKFKNIIVSEQKKSINEFEADFEDHEIGNQNIYRLHFIGYYNASYGRSEPHQTSIDWRCKPFTLPEGMNRADAFKVLSYLTDYIEKVANLQEASLQSVMTLDSVLNLERFGFSKFPYQIEDSHVIDLFTVAGRIRRFLSSPYYPKYFEWYTPNISKEEVEKIYQSIGMSFIPPIFNSNNQEEKQKTNVKKQ